jgi:hypothetical protein
MNHAVESSNKALVLEAFDTLFNKRDYMAAERYCYLDPETHKALLQAALHENTSATELVERLIKRYLRGRRKT